jgi:hypothetical protein
VKQIADLKAQSVNDTPDALKLRNQKIKEIEDEITKLTGWDEVTIQGAASKINNYYGAPYGFKIIRDRNGYPKQIPVGVDPSVYLEPSGEFKAKVDLLPGDYAALTTKPSRIPDGYKIITLPETTPPQYKIVPTADPEANYYEKTVSMYSGQKPFYQWKNNRTASPNANAQKSNGNSIVMTSSPSYVYNPGR